MGVLRVTVCVLLVCTLLQYSSGQKLASFSLDVTPSSVAMDRNSGEVFVAVGSRLLRLSRSLSLLGSTEDVGGGGLFRIALSPDGSRLVGCINGGDERTCFVYDARNLSAGANVTVPDAFYNPTNGLAIVVTNDSFYLGSEGDLGEDNDNIYLAQYNYTSGVVRTSGDVRFRVQGNSFVRQFYGGINVNGYIYYFVADQMPNAIRVLRVCDCSRYLCSSDQFRAMYERTVECATSATENNRVCGIDLVESLAGLPGPHIVMTRCEENTGIPRNRICSFKLADIDNDMDTLYNECTATPPTQSDFELPWDSGSRSCSAFENQNPVPCDFGPSGAAAISDTGFRFATLLISTETSFISATLAITVDDVSLVYVAHNGTVEVYHVTTLAATTMVHTIPNVPSSVVDIGWEEDSDVITITTETEVFLYPLETCSNSTSCEECTGTGRFPLCGWCTVENKCSRSSQCTNSTKTRRWVTATDQCIITTVDPNQFILDSPTILNVTADPALPSGLTYNCSFSTANSGAAKFPLVVPAIEIATGEAYQCNITDIATSLNSVKQATDFSFVSIEVGIPFATSEGALTIFNCSAARSCVECLDTAGACGWCLYGGSCSGIPDSCPSPSGVNNSYLTLNGRTPAEVCPILNRASTPSGDYTQPEGVARDLVLMTSNLPPPVESFRYMCRVGSETFTAELNAISGAVTCLIPANRLILSTGMERVLLSLVWTNGTISYTINEENMNNIMCILYNCMALETSCSSCLGANVDGFTCGWCDSPSQCLVQERCSGVFTTTTDGCPLPMIDSITPARGPTGGRTRVTILGTNLGASADDITQIRLSEAGGTTVECEQDVAAYVRGKRIVCVTQPVASPGSYTITVSIQRGGNTQNKAVSFTIEEPELTGVVPAFGPKSGGILVAVNGTSLGVGNTANTTVQLDGMECVVNVTELSDGRISCRAGSFDGNVTTSGGGPVIVNIDGADITENGVDFQYRADPIFTSVSPQMVIPAGGIIVTFSGVGLDVVLNPMFSYTENQQVIGNCMPEADGELTCIVPYTPTSQIMSNISYTVMYGLAPGPDITMDLLVLQVRPNPVFDEEGDAFVSTTSFSPGSGAPLTLRGTNLDSVRASEINVTVGGEICSPRISDDNEDPNEYTCFVPKDPPNGMDTAEVVVKVGTNLTYTVGTVTYTSEASQLSVIIGASAGGGILILLILIMFFVICCVMRRARAREKRFTNLLAQMELWESEMADECKRAFTELQTDLADLVQISDDKNLPYRDFRSFAMRFLFPSAGSEHPVLNPLAVADPADVVPHLKTFQSLISDKKFLLLFVRTLEAQQGRFSLQDKCNVASLLMVAFQNDLAYATEILQTLLSDVMHQAVLKSHPKLLLRRTETVAEKMLANWLCFLLFPYLLEHAGEPLFILFRAIKSQLEKGPVDVITGEARHSLSEEKLLRQKFEAQVVDGVVETESGEQIAVKLLDCDTITQAKDKILDTLYKNTAISKRPQLVDVDLELRRANAGIPLRDYDTTNVKDGDWLKINTLGHYRLAEMSQAAIDNPKNPVPSFKLVPRHERPVSGISFDHVGTIIANLSSGTTIQSGGGGQVYHLTKPEQGDGDEGTGPRQGKILSEVFLTRLLSTKRILQPYVDDLFKGIFAIPRGKPLAKAIKFLFDFLDLQAADLGITDPEILHTWKTNSLFLRFWVGLIKNPDFVFDIHKSATVDACLTIIAQAYIDSCSTSEMKYNKNTPSAKLLYVNEVRSYKTEVQQYYSTVQSLPKLSQYDMSEYLRETAQVCSQSVEENDSDIKHIFMTRQLYFVTESALYELFKFAATYSSELQDALNDEGLSVMAAKLQQLQAAIKV